MDRKRIGAEKRRVIFQTRPMFALEASLKRQNAVSMKLPKSSFCWSVSPIRNLAL
jgi:hypothetical protein